MRKRGKFFIFLLIVILAIVLLVVLKPFNHQGEKSKEAVVTAFFAALESNNAQALIRLTPSDYESKNTAEQMMKKYGGNTFKINNVKYIQSLTIATWFAVITGTTTDKNGKTYPYTEQLTLREEKNGWFLLLGPQKSSGPKVYGPKLKITPPKSQ